MHAPASLSSILNIRPEAEHAPTSGIVDVFNYGRNRKGLIPLWVGEGDLPTPAFITDAAIRSLGAGETFYTYQRGIPDLREAIAGYLARLYRHPVDPERIFVTSGGMPAMQIVMRMVAGNGDDVLVPTPAWPNFMGALVTVGRAAGRRSDDDHRDRVDAGFRAPGGGDHAPHPRHRRSTRPPTRPDGPRPWTTCARCSTWPAGMDCGSSPTRSTAASSTSRR